MLKLRIKLLDIWKIITSKEYIIISSNNNCIIPCPPHLKKIHISLQVYPISGLDLIEIAEKLLEKELEIEANEQIERLVNQ